MQYLTMLQRVAPSFVSSAFQWSVAKRFTWFGSFYSFKIMLKSLVRVEAPYYVVQPSDLLELLLM